MINFKKISILDLTFGTVTTINSEVKQLGKNYLELLLLNENC